MIPTTDRTILVDLDVPAAPRPRRRSRWLAVAVLAPLLALGAAPGSPVPVVSVDVGRWTVRATVTVPAAAVETVLLTVTTTGTARTWTLGVLPAIPALHLVVVDPDGVAISGDLRPIPVDPYGREWTVVLAGEDVTADAFNAYADLEAADGTRVLAGFFGPVPGQVGAVVSVF